MLEFAASCTDAAHGTIQVLGQVLRAENAKMASFSKICTSEYILLNQLHW